MGQLLRHPYDVRQLGITGIYFSLLGLMYFVPAFRNPICLAAACYFSFLINIVIHNHLHQGMFISQRLNGWMRMLLSFGALYPVSANIPAHNLVHHHFDDDGQPDWASPQNVRFKWHLLNLLHFPNVAGPTTFAGVQRWMQHPTRRATLRQFQKEQVFAFGLTFLILVHDFWAGLFFVVLPQLYGARCILRINIIQHDDCDLASRVNHSRNFVGRAFNWVMCNNGYHTIHHNRPGMHWSLLADAHQKEIVPHADRDLDEPSIVLYLLKTYGLRMARPSTPREKVMPIERVGASSTAEQSGGMHVSHS